MRERRGTCAYEAKLNSGTLSLLTVHTDRPATELKKFAETCTNRSVELVSLQILNDQLTGFYLEELDPEWSSFECWISDGVYQLQVAFSGRGNLESDISAIREALARTRRRSRFHL